ETVCSGNAGDGVFRLAAGALHDQRAAVLRAVRVADVDRDPRFAHREDGVFVKYACAHIGELAELLISDRLDGLRLLDDSRVSNQEAGYIRPVLIQVSP